MYGTDPASPQFTNAAPVAGFTDASKRYWPVAFTAKRVELALGLGIDLAQAMTTPQGPTRLLGNGGRTSLVQIVRLAFIGAGGDDDPDAPGFMLAGSFMTPEAFASVMANAKTFKGATIAILEALAAHFPGTPGSQSIIEARPRLRAKGK